MKFFILFFGLLFSLLQSPYVFSETTDFKKHYLLGLKAIRGKNYTLSVQHLKKSLEFEPKNQAALKFLAISASQVKDNESVISSSNTLLSFNNDNYIRIILAQSYEATEKIDEAIAQYQAIISAKDQDLKETALDALKRLNVKPNPQEIDKTDFFPRPNGFSGLFITSFEHNDNIATDINDSTSALREVDDESVTFTYNLNYDLNFFDRFYAGIGFLGVNNYYEGDATQFELGFYRANAHIGIVGKGRNLKLAYERDFIEFSHDDVITSDRVSLTYIDIISPYYVFMLFPSISRDDFIDNVEQVAIKSTIETHNRFYLPELWQGAYANLKYRWQYNDTDDVSVYSYESHKYGMELHAPLTVWDIYAKGTIDYEKRLYDNNPTSRKEATLTYRFTLGKTWFKDIRTEVYYNRMKRKSTVDVFDKTQDIYGAKFIYSF